MTKEEALKILRSGDIDALLNHYSYEEIQQAIDLVVTQPSLPFDLDEAAEEIVRDWLAYGDGEFEKLVIAGAEWMAGQFQKIEGELVDWYSTSEGKDYCCGVKTIDAFEVPEGFYIRKK